MPLRADVGRPPRPRRRARCASRSSRTTAPSRTGSSRSTAGCATPGRVPACHVRLFLRDVRRARRPALEGRDDDGPQGRPAGRRGAVRRAAEGSRGRPRLAGTAARRPRGGPHPDELAARRARRGRGAGLLGGLPVSALVALRSSSCRRRPRRPTPAPTPDAPPPASAGPRTLQDVARERRLRGARRARAALGTLTVGPSTASPTPKATPDAPEPRRRPKRRPKRRPSRNAGGRRRASASRRSRTTAIVDGVGAVRVNGTVRNTGSRNPPATSSSP